MAYSTVAMIQAAIGEEALRQVSDLDNAGSVNVAVVEAAIDDADAVIDSYVGQRSAVPLSPVPRTIANLSAGWAIRTLRRNINKGVPNPEDQAADERDEKWLIQVAKGLVSLGVDPAPPKASSIIDKAGQRSASLEISKERMKGFI